MRIDLSNAYAAGVNEAEKANVKTAQEVKEQDSVSSDLSAQVQLSGLAQQVTSAPEIRPERVDQLRQAMASGTYSVSDQALAGAMMRDVLQQ